MKRNDAAAVVTIPISPPAKEKAGILALCTVADVLRNKVDANGYLCINMNDSYTDRRGAEKKLLTNIERIGLESSIWRDENKQDHIIQNIEKLIAKGLIKKKEVTTVVCDCGKVDCKKESISTIQDSKVFRKEGEEIVCNSCDTLAVPVTDQALVFCVPNIVLGVQTVPAYLGKEIRALHEKFSEKEIVISKKRNTSLSLSYQGELFNVDTDFCSYNFLSAFDEKKKIVVATSHVTYQLYMISLLNKLCSPEDDTVLLSMAYINGNSGLQINEKSIDSTRKKLFLTSAFNLSKETQWPDGALNYAKNKPAELIAMIDDKMSEYSPQSQQESWHEYVQRIAVKELNFAKIRQQQTQAFKKLKKHNK